ncbi:putative Zinc finger, RanBP2-type [Lupinus albus]|uniref:Putative Zinc finger, RanBP2-type n=1 Tax=Lupinus albus TaxID=3870 RepID=A0A6A4PGD2_LUPAL|nr:putative Zinc finger, RanBP2-type [Lupinus albus]
MSRPGDWNCKSCQHLNFQRRDSCQRCGDSKYGDRDDFGKFGGRGGSSFGFSTIITGSDVRPGDWYCAAPNCAAHNFASRSSCFKCGAFKDDFSGGCNSNSTAFNLHAGAGFGGGGGGGGGGSRPGWKSGDWICNRFGCNEHNFASRMVCFKCSSPREMFF